jgi:hypothetical protein
LTHKQATFSLLFSILIIVKEILTNIGCFSANNDCTSTNSGKWTDLFEESLTLAQATEGAANVTWGLKILRCSCYYIAPVNIRVG